ncbi:MAG TPA: SPOR domain-containing protein [Sphingomicrobium sp.]|nr:SPOR domain-containing protein [Sphingomicrobium sp.]
MVQPLRMSSAASLIVLGSIIGGCAVQHTHMAAASHVDGKPVELGFATRALAALISNDVPAAIGFAEKAAAKSPTDAAVRTLLGNSYFAAGRFLSAEAAYRDSLTIDTNQPKVILKLALVEIAQGKDNRAVAMLKDARGLLEASDYGLALALAGRPADAIATLEPAARMPGADATVRQNLALAHALAGDWDEARIIAGQDVPASQLDARMQQWMQLAKPAHAADQVASVVGVTPAVTDPGQPIQLALNKDDPRAPQKLASAGIRLADAAPAVAVAPVRVPTSPHAEGPNPSFVAAIEPSVAHAPHAIPAVAPAPSVSRPVVVALAASAVAEAKAVLASFMPRRVVSQSAPIRARLVPAARPAVQPGKSQAVVQLGAYESPERVLAAWNGAAHKYGALKAYAPMSARFASPKGTFYRLSVRGFNSVTEAKALCGALHRSGGACFVRNVAGDAPVNIALR